MGFLTRLVRCGSSPEDLSQPQSISAAKSTAPPPPPAVSTITPSANSKPPPVSLDDLTRSTISSQPPRLDPIIVSEPEEDYLSSTPLAVNSLMSSSSAPRAEAEVASPATITAADARDGSATPPAFRTPKQPTDTATAEPQEELSHAQPAVFSAEPEEDDEAAANEPREDPLQPHTTTSPLSTSSRPTQAATSGSPAEESSLSGAQSLEMDEGPGPLEMSSTEDAHLSSSPTSSEIDLPFVTSPSNMSDADYTNGDSAAQQNAGGQHLSISSATVPLPTRPPRLNPPQRLTQPQLGKLAVNNFFSLSPPTPVDGPKSAGGSISRPDPLPLTVPSPTSRAATPPRSASPDPMSPPQFPLSSSPEPTERQHTLSPELGPSPGSPWTMHRRRNSSISSRRSFKETLNAYSAEGADGRCVNQYIFRERLGSGSYATVERATDRQTGIDYAVKEFSKVRLRRRQTSEAMKGGRGPRGPRGRPPPRVEAADPVNFDQQGPINLALVQKEVAIMKKLEHPNIASVHEVIDVTSDDALLVVMELCGGGPIAHVSLEQQGEPMAEDRARFIFAQMVMGVAYLHHNKVVHRDIKPENALLTADKEVVKLVDFGISEMIETDVGDMVQKSVGSPAFMAPELVSKTHEHMHGYACDIWSLGVTLFAMVAGRLPFAKDNIVDLMEAISNDEISYPTHLTPSLLHLLKRMLVKDPHQRVTVKELWNDPWTTDDGLADLVPYDDNCREPMGEPTKTERDSALKAQQSLSTSVAVLRAANKLRRGTRRSESGSGSMDSGPQLPGTPSRSSSMGITPEPSPSPSLLRAMESADPNPGDPTPLMVNPPVRSDTGSSSVLSFTSHGSVSVPSTPGSSDEVVKKD